MSKVFVLDTNRQPLNPAHPGWARKLLSAGKAAVFRHYPFTIILKEAIIQPELQTLRLKIDPGSRMTGLAIVNDATGEVVFAAELSHRAVTIAERMRSRSAARRSRRNRKTRYRPARFHNRSSSKRKGLRQPCMRSRVSNIMTWVNRLRTLCPIASISLEFVKFDIQAMDNPEIKGVEYQQDTRAGYELREYLLHKWERKCAYCGAEGVPLQIEHIQPVARGGTNRTSNLALACEKCNQRKGAMDVRDFLKRKPATLKHILDYAQKESRTDPAALNATRWTLYRRLQETGLPLEVGSGGLTKYNREKRGLPKTHWIDAACVGSSTPEALLITQVRPLLIQATGSGNRKMCRFDSHGFRKRNQDGQLSQARRRVKRYLGFQTGDVVRANKPRGEYAGEHVGRVTVRTDGELVLDTAEWRGLSCSRSYSKVIQLSDGYGYTSAAPTRSTRRRKMRRSGQYPYRR